MSETEKENEIKNKNIEKENKNKENEYSYLRTFKFFYKSLGSNKLGFILSVVGFGVSSSLYFVASFMLAKLIDYITIKPVTNTTYLYLLVISVIVIYGTDKWVRIISGYFLNKIRINTQMELRKNIFDKLAMFDLKWHQNKNSGSKVEKINSGIGGYTSLFNLFEWSIMWNLMNFIIPLGFFAFLGWKYLIVFLVFGVLVLCIKLFIQSIINNNNTKLEDIQEISTNKFFEFSNNILTIKALNAIQVFKKSIFRADETKQVLQLENNKLETREDMIRSIGETFIIDLFLILFLLNDYLKGDLTLGTFQLAFNNSWSITWAIISMSRVAHQVNEAKIKISRLIPIFEEKPNLFFGEEKFNHNWKTLNIKDLDFDYNINGIDTPALIGINLKLEKGKKYGFVGHSGSGKSTLTKLMVGLFEAKAGNIEFQGEVNQNLYDLHFNEVANNISIVLQETELFDISLRENLSMLKDRSDESILNAIRIAQLDSVLNKLPEGLDTVLGEKGYKLSGGEKQRLGIARAILTDAEIIILDEATSALDTQTELLIQNAIELELKDKTLIMVAHRLSTLKNVDKIYVFSNGKLLEEGNFDNLANDSKTHFYKLWQNQIRK